MFTFLALWGYIALQHQATAITITCARYRGTPQWYYEVRDADGACFDADVIGWS